LNVNFFAAPPVTAAPGSLFYYFLPGSTVPQTQQVNINTSPAGPFTSSVLTSNGSNFLSVNPTSGSSPGTLNVTVNPAGLTSGYYFGAVAVNPPGTTGLNIPVQVNVGVQTAINLQPQFFSFAYQTGTTPPPVQTIYLTTTNGPVGFTATTNTTDCIGKWLIVSPQNGIAPGTLTIRIDPTGLRPGSCNGSIYITAPGALNQSFSLPVTLVVSNAPVLQLPSSVPAISYQTGGTVPGPFTIPVGSSTGTLDYSVATSSAGIGPNLLTANPTSGTTPQPITLTVNSAMLAGLMPGIYGENVTVTSNSATPEQTLTIPFFVSNGPALVTAPQSLIFNYSLAQPMTPANQMINVSSTGAAVAYVVSSSTSTCSGFLTATTSTGTTPPSGGQAQVTVAVNPIGLTTPQTCYGNVSIAVPGSNGPVTNIPVVFNVTM
jgi:hypothetical protein